MLYCNCLEFCIILMTWSKLVPCCLWNLIWSTIHCTNVDDLRGIHTLIPKIGGMLSRSNPSIFEYIFRSSSTHQKRATAVAYHCFTKARILLFAIIRISPLHQSFDHRLHPSNRVNFYEAAMSFVREPQPHHFVGLDGEFSCAPLFIVIDHQLHRLSTRKPMNFGQQSP